LATFSAVTVIVKTVPATGEPVLGVTLKCVAGRGTWALLAFEKAEKICPLPAWRR